MKTGEAWLNRPIALASAIGSLTLLAVAPGSAQDIEAVAHLEGITLPEAYYQRMARTLPTGGHFCLR